MDRAEIRAELEKCAEVQARTIAMTIQGAVPVGSDDIGPALRLVDSKGHPVLAPLYADYARTLDALERMTPEVEVRVEAPDAGARTSRVDRPAAAVDGLDRRWCQVHDLHVADPRHARRDGPLCQTRDSTVREDAIAVERRERARRSSDAER